MEDDERELVSSHYFPVKDEFSNEGHLTEGGLSLTTSMSSPWEELSPNELRLLMEEAQAIENHSRSLSTVQEIGLVIDEISSTPSAPPNTPARNEFQLLQLPAVFGQTVEEEVTSWPTKILRFITSFLRPSPLSAIKEEPSEEVTMAETPDLQDLIPSSLAEAIQSVEVKREQLCRSTNTDSINTLVQEFMEEAPTDIEENVDLGFLKEEEEQPGEVEETRRMGTHRVSFKPVVRESTTPEKTAPLPISRQNNGVRKTTRFAGQSGTLEEFVRQYLVPKKPPGRPNYLKWLGPSPSKFTILRPVIDLRN